MVYIGRTFMFSFSDSAFFSMGFLHSSKAYLLCRRIFSGGDHHLFNSKPQALICSQVAL